MDGRRTSWLARHAVLAAAIVAGRLAGIAPGPVGRHGSQQPVRTVRRRPTRSGRQRRPGSIGSRRSRCWPTGSGTRPSKSSANCRKRRKASCSASRPHRFIGLREWCQLRLAALPPEALKLYRGRVDPVARKWYEQGIAKRDRKLLREHRRSGVRQQFRRRRPDGPGRDGAGIGRLCRGAMELGADRAGRASWPIGSRRHCHKPWPSYPDTNLDLAAVRARLVLVSILEGATDRARGRIGRVRQAASRRPRPARRPRGPIRRTAANRCWPRAPRGRRPRPIADWPTFAGNPQRNKTAAPLVDVGAVAWRVPLRPAAAPLQARWAPRPSAKIPASR